MSGRPGSRPGESSVPRIGSPTRRATVALLAATVLAAGTVRGGLPWGPAHRLFGSAAPSEATVEKPEATRTPTRQPIPDKYHYSVGGQSLPEVFASASGIAVDPEGHVYLSADSEHRIQVLTPSGDVRCLWGLPGKAPGRLAAPAGVAAGGGVVLVADRGNERVQRFTACGTYAGQLDAYQDPDLPRRAGRFRPVDVALLNDGGIAVADWLKNRIVTFDSAGRFLSVWGGSGAGDGELTGIVALDAARDDVVYVVEAGGRGRIQYFDRRGLLLGAWEARGTRDIAARADRVYAVGGESFGLRWYSRNGALQGEIALAGPGSSGGADLMAPFGVAVDDAGLVHVLDAGGSDDQARIVRFDSTGTYRDTWLGGRASGGVIDPAAISLDVDGWLGHDDGRLVVADQAHGRVEVLHPEGRHLDTWGDEAAGGPEIVDPVGITAANRGDVFVSDRGRHRVLRLSGDGVLLSEIGTGLGDELDQFGPSGPGEVDTNFVLSGWPERLWVADPSNTRVLTFDFEGRPAGSIGSAGSGDGQFCGGCVDHITSSTIGRIYVTENSALQRVLAFNWLGEHEFTFQGILGDDSRFAPLAGIDYATVHRVFLSDPRGRIQVFSSDGRFEDQWDLHTVNPALVVSPGDLAVGVGPRLFLADRWNNRVHVFGPDLESEWRGEYYPNCWIAGPPIAVDYSADVSFDWSGRAPLPGLAEEGYSGRFTRVVPLADGRYEVRVDADGGVRLWLDDRLLIDSWQEREMERVASFAVAAGTHLAELHYTHDSPGRGAYLHLRISRQGALRTPRPSPTGATVTATPLPPLPSTPTAHVGPSGTPGASPTPSSTVTPRPTLRGTASPTPTGSGEVAPAYLPCLEQKGRSPRP